MAELEKHPPSGVVTLNIKDVSGLYAAYMPFLKGGGIFFPTTRPYRLGDEILMLLYLPNDTTKYTVSGRVAWVMPAGAHKMQGVGIQFSDTENRADILGRIENLLAGTLASPRPTHTM